jgi:hypothetical protein
MKRMACNNFRRKAANQSKYWRIRRRLSSQYMCNSHTLSPNFRFPREILYTFLIIPYTCHVSHLLLFSTVSNILRTVQIKSLQQTCIFVWFCQKPRLWCVELCDVSKVMYWCCEGCGKMRSWSNFEALSQNLHGVSEKNLPGNPSARR